MALGDGTSWDETLPTDNTQAVQIDDHILDVRKGIRSRFALEHESPASQTGTSEAGRHKYITLQEQTGQPTAITGTQIAGVYASSHSTQGFELFFARTGTGSGNVRITDGTGLNLNAGKVLQLVSTLVATTTTIGDTYTPDTSIPQSSELTAIISKAITPQSTDSNIVVFVDVSYVPNTVDAKLTWGLFNEEEHATNAIRAWGDGGTRPSGYVYGERFMHITSSPSTTSTTFTFKGAPSSESLHINSISGGTQFHSGALFTMMIVAEVTT